MSLALPTEKQPPTLSPERSKVLLYGPPKIGKTTLAAGLDPDKTLFLATEPGLGALEVFSLPIRSWEEFREAGAALAKDPGQFTTVVIDTVDELSKLCSDATLEKLGVSHAADLEYGKGWAAIADEFRLRVGKLASLGLGVWFISHSKEVEIASRVGKITKIVPTIGGQSRTFLVGFVDFILLAQSELGDDGERRVLRTAATENYEAGGRVQLPDPLPLDAGELRKAMKAACTPEKPKRASNGRKAAEPEAVAA